MPDSAFDLADRLRSLVEVLFLWSIRNKYIKAISAIYKTSTAADKVRNFVGSWFLIISGVSQECVLCPVTWII